MQPRVLLIGPPFTQLNTPYPATAYLKGFLNTQGVHSQQIDLGLATILRLFSAAGLRQVFDQAGANMHKASANAQRMYALRHRYEQTIDPVIHFLQDDDPTLAYQICTGKLLPEAGRSASVADMDFAFGLMGIRDKARHMATLYLEDISDLIVECIDPHFGFSRYAESLALSARSFDQLHTTLQGPGSLVTDIMLSLLRQEVEQYAPTLVAISVPFPGNLLAALRCGQWIKAHHPTIKVAMGGGYPNTELRSLNEPRVFDFVDLITLDDGEAPLMQILAHLQGQLGLEDLKRTFVRVDGVVHYCNNSRVPEMKKELVGMPDYTGLPLRKYLSVIETTNPMHRLWSDGRWNKLTMAHGCYWGKCTFCDISLDYIKRYEANSASLIVDRMTALVEQTGQRGFHFVDEAAPPALMKAVAIEIVRRGLVVTWWTNIRFEKSFTLDLCRLLAHSGCVAVSGGLEVASNRLLALIDKGVTVEQVTRVCDHFNRARIMVHAYLMYGFPTQTAQETIDSLEVVRQLFEADVLQSGFWHRFAMTAHSPVGIDPSGYKVIDTSGPHGTFANNGLEHDDPTGADHDQFRDGLNLSLANFMRGAGLDEPLHEWFEMAVPTTSLAPALIESYLDQADFMEVKPHHQVVWIGGPVHFNPSKGKLMLMDALDDDPIKCKADVGHWLTDVLPQLAPSNGKIFTYSELEAHHQQAGMEHFSLLWHGKIGDVLRQSGLLVV